MQEAVHKPSVWNWGTGIAIVIVLACCGIVFMVYKASTYNFEMVTKDYYAQELTYNDKLTAIQNANALDLQLAVAVEQDVVIVKLPPSIPSSVKGQVVLYCTVDASKDITRVLVLDKNNMMLFPKSALIHSGYKAIVTFTWNDKPYYFEQEFVVK